MSIGDTYLEIALKKAESPKHGLKDCLLNLRQYYHIVENNPGYKGTSLELVNKLIEITEPAWYNHGHCPLRKIHNIPLQTND